MTSKSIVCVLLLSVLLAACKDDRREEQLAARELALQERENAFALKEADYQLLLNMRDSLATVKDTVVTLAWPDSVTGIWDAKLVCRESNCNDYAIGDVRLLNWEFVSDSSGIFTKVLNKDKLIRVYAGGLNNETIQLHYATDSAAVKKVNMDVTVNPIDTNSMKGEQIVTINDNCNAKFSVELTRSKTR